MVQRILGSLLTGVVGAHDSHGCSHRSKAFCRPRCVLGPAPRAFAIVRGHEPEGGKQNLRQSYIRDISRAPWRPADKLCAGPLEVLRVIALLPYQASYAPGDPLLKG